MQWQASEEYDNFFNHLRFDTSNSIITLEKKISEIRMLRKYMDCIDVI